MATLFRSRGYDIVSFDEYADVYVINTCTVTHQGDAKSRKLIRRAKRQNPNAVVVVAGCYAQTNPEEVSSIPGVDVILGNNHRHAVVDLVEVARGTAEPICKVENLFRAQNLDADDQLTIDGFGEKTRAVIKVQDGCTEFCTYCIIPYARGMLRSRRPGAIVRQAQQLVERGYKEVVLAGIHLGAYGKDFSDDVGIADLLSQLIQVDGLERIRLSSIEPMDVDTKLLEIMASSPKVCKHLHLPLQSGCDEVLRRMKRRYTTAQFRELVKRARELMPDIAITTDIMVGFPGETEEQHIQSYEFISEIGFSRLHVFPYSPRQGTPAATFDGQVDPRVQRRRVDQLLELGEKLALNFHQRFIGQRAIVLVHKEPEQETSFCNGYTDNYIPVIFDTRGTCWRAEALGGQLVEVFLEQADAKAVTGSVIGIRESVNERVLDPVPRHSA